VLRVHMNGESKVPGFLEDHAAVALAFIALHEATFNSHWLHEARRIGAEMRVHFRDASSGTWYDTADDAETLITRPRETSDNAVPAGQSLALELMLRLAELDGSSGASTEVVAQLAAQTEAMAKWPNGFGHLLGVADLVLFGAVAVAIVGAPDGDDFQALARVVSQQYLPTLALVGGAANGAGTAALLADRAAIDGGATAYVCRDFVCDAPTTSARELERQLDQARNGSNTA
jgi:uncharacterized protein YyaL (SSP411 family)